MQSHTIQLERPGRAPLIKRGQRTENALFGWWSVAALMMVPIIGKEGVEALRGEKCCDDEGCHQ